MTQDIYITIPEYHKEEIMEQANPQTSQANSKLCISMYDIQHLSALLTATIFFLLGWLYSILDFLLRYPTVLAFLTSWGLQSNFNFIASSSSVRDLHTIFRPLPKGLDHFSSFALCSTLGSGWLHTTASAVLVGHPMILTPPICWGLPLQLCFVNSFS